MRRMFGFISGILAISGGFATLIASAETTSGRVGSISAAASATRRAPTMPTMPANTTGNTGVNLPASAGATSEPTAYTIDMCMTDLSTCISGGALPNGLNDLYNSDLRNSILNGMNLCATQVDKCVNDVTRNGVVVYHSASDVWIDFNSRIVQPNYFSFVLQQTGLTPNQAENTCALLDKNTYGTSFAAVSNDGEVTTEYAQNVGAYNKQGGGSLDKDAPQGVKANTGNSGYDGQRGYYARWDATNGECLVRVAAYNKNSQINNTWLFGVAGDDKPAEVWKSAGKSFSCNKDLFGFSLMNKTSTMAVVGTGSGALLGAGIGATAGANAKRVLNCDEEADRKVVKKEIDDMNLSQELNIYTKSNLERGKEMTKEQCIAILELQTKVAEIKLDPCYDDNLMNCRPAGIDSILETPDDITFYSLGATSRGIRCNVGAQGCVDGVEIANQVRAIEKTLLKVETLQQIEGGKALKGTLIGAGVGAAAGGLATAITAFVEKNNISCRVGDGLDTVAFGKSGKIDSLKDYYVKWNLRLPDTILPTAQVVDCNSWKNACGTIKDISQCAAAQVNYKPANVQRTTMVDNACAVSGSVCIENYPVAVSNGACR